MSTRSSTTISGPPAPGSRRCSTPSRASGPSVTRSPTLARSGNLDGRRVNASLRAALEREVAETVGATCHDDAGQRGLTINGPPPKFHGTRDILPKTARKTRATEVTTAARRSCRLFVRERFIMTSVPSIRMIALDVHRAGPSSEGLGGCAAVVGGFTSRSARAACRLSPPPNASCRRLRTPNLRLAFLGAVPVRARWGD